MSMPEFSPDVLDVFRHQDLQCDSSVFQGRVPFSQLITNCG
jgi:hypothetical protein